MAKPPYRALSFGLRLVSALIAFGSLFMILSDRALILRVFLHPPASEVSTLLLALLKEMGGVMLMVSVMLFLAARDPVRNVAILDALIAGLCILSYYAAAVPQDARFWQALSSVFNLGASAGQVDISRSAVLCTSAGD